jgi:predicted DNA-binding protein (UPF0251 family)
LREGRSFVTPRPKKPRNYVCTLCSQYEQIFKPARTPLAQLEIVSIFHDEIEALFLCDSQGMDQKTAGINMGVSRATVQRLLAKGRKKLIETLVRKRALAVVPTLKAYAADSQSDRSTARQPVAGGCDPSGPCTDPTIGCDVSPQVLPGTPR